MRQKEQVRVLVLILVLITGLHGLRKGRKQKAPRTQAIVGGTTSSLEKWPWQLAILTMQGESREFTFRCGATLITPNLALTAAHCVTNPDLTIGQVKVIAGEYDRSVKEGSEQEFTITHIVTHQNYTGSLYDLFRHDIAVLRLNRSANINKYVKIVPGLADETTVIDKMSVCCMIGWGVNTATKGKGKGKGKKTTTSQPAMTDTLEEAEVRVLTNTVCNKKSYWSGLIKPAQICAFNKKISACLGDSGGPLMCRRGIGSPFIQVGVTSWGSKECNGKPSVFTRLSSYTRWIISIIHGFKTLTEYPTYYK